MKTLAKPIHAILTLALAATMLHTHAHADDDLRVRHIIRQTLYGDERRHFANVVYDEPFDEYIGRAGLRLQAPPFFKVEKDADGLLTRVTSDVMELLIRPSEEAWTAEDPMAFEFVSRFVDGEVIARVTTIARLHRDGMPVNVMRIVDFGRRIDGTTRMSHPEGRVTRSEMTSPDLGISITLRGPETHAGFTPTSRSIFTKYRDNPFQRVHRTRQEVLCPNTGDWLMRSDVLTERQNLRGHWLPTLEIQDPDGEAIREEWEYYTFGEKSGPDGYTESYRSVKRHLRKDGTEIRYQYTATQTITEIVHPDGTTEVITGPRTR